MPTEELEYAGAGGDRVRAFLALPESPKTRGGIVCVHEVFGLDDDMREVARRLAAAGYAALVPDLYSRAGLPGPAPTAADPVPAWSIEVVRAAVAGLPDRRVLADLEAGLFVLAERAGLSAEPRAGELGALGLCMGGNYAYLLGCHTDRVSAVVDFYGRIVYPELSPNKPIQPLEMALNLSAPLLGLFAGDDPSIPREHVTAFEERLAQFAKRAEIHVFDGARHGFFNPSRGAWDAEAAARAWDLVLSFLADELATE